MSRFLKLSPLFIVVSGCSFFQGDTYQPETPDVAEIVSELDRPVIDSQPLDELSVANLIDRFEVIKAGSENAEEQYQISQRLAQLRLLAVEQQLAEGETDIDFATPIAELEGLLSFSPTADNAAEIAYQLARMQEMKGAEDQVLKSLSDLIELNQDYAETLEARFRRAEIHFSRNEFTAAASDYELVANTTGQYQLHARYMLTWVQFKRGDLDGALAMATAALTQMAENSFRTHTELKQDLLRVTVIALDYAQGAETLAQLMSKEGKPDWQTDVYRALGDWYLKKSRFADSAETWATFLSENPLHRDAPRIALQVIATQREAGFAEDIPGLEVSFVQRYGKQSEFFAMHGETVFVLYQEALKPMLDRQTQRLHAVAQESKRQLDYLAAAGAYHVWLVNFAEHGEAQQKRFLYAEVLQAGGELAESLVQYEAVVGENPTSVFAREAAYAIVLGEQTLSKQAEQEQGVVQNPEAEITANLQFAALFSDDVRAPSSQLKAANLLFKSQQFARALLIAKSAMGFELKGYEVETAILIIGHSAFELEQYALAAKQYRAFLASGSGQNHLDKNKHEEIQQRLLATVFKQGQQAETQGDQEAAIEFYRSLADIDPTSDLSRDAQYDIAAIYEQMGELDLATRQLETYRQRYSEHQQDVALRLVALYEQTGNLEAAATELLASVTTEEAARVARFRAAELFLEAGNLDLAIEHFRFYAHNYVTPASLRLEAMHHMDLLYQQTGDRQKRHFWLRKKRDAYADLAAADKTERARFLAAEASFVLAEDQFDAFQSVRLTQPLARSLKKKQQLLETSLKHYQDIAAIGVLEFVTRSNYQMASLYQILAKDLLASEQPDDLNELEQDQYVMLLEEQAFPFEEEAIVLHQRNLQLGWEVSWDDAINNSLTALQRLSPGRFMRQEAEVSYVQSSD